MRKPSIKDVAQSAGVSIATVSYVLNGKHSERITAATKSKILDAINKIGYQPNKIAQSLKTNHSKIIGFVVADITNPFFSEMAQLIENEAIKQGFTVLVGSADEDAEKFQKLVSLFLQQRVEGLILAPVDGCEATISQLKNEDVPFVFIDRYIPDYQNCSVRINNASISKTIALHLAKKGIKKPLIISYKSPLTHLEERRSGFLNSFNGDIREVKVQKEHIAADVWNGLSHYFQDVANLPDALYFTSNKLAFEGLKFLIYKHQTEIQHIEIIAFDKSLVYEMYPGTIYYVQQPLKQMAEETIKMLKNKMENTNHSIVDIQLDAQLITEEYNYNL